MISNEPFYFPGSQSGALLVHGFTGSPSEMRYLGEQLNRKGFSVSGIRLAGHGTSANDLSKYRWPDWLSSVEEGLAALSNHCQEIHLVGFSLGGALALNIAARHPQRIRSLVLIATPLWLPFYTKLGLTILKKTKLNQKITTLPKLLTGDIRDRSQLKQLDIYPAYSVDASLNVMEFIASTRKIVDEITCPALILHSLQDHTVPYRCSTELKKRLPHAKRITFFRSFHMLPVDAEKERVAKEVEQFLFVNASSPNIAQTA